MRLLLFPVFAALAACAVEPSPPPTVPPPIPAPPLCPVQYSNNWRAWIDAMPGPGGTRPTLHVSGTVKMIDGTRSVAFRPTSQVMESNPVNVIVDLAVTPRVGGSAGDAVPYEVRGSWPSEARVGGVTVRCLDTTLATITQAEIAH